MRLFIALDLPAAIKAELVAVQQRLQEAGARPLRWAKVEGLHLTLQFLGEQPSTLIDSLLAALAALPPGDFTLRLEGVGAFPSRKSPRVLWIGLGGDLGALHALQQHVVASTTPLGIAAEARPYHPHLTLGRVPEDAERQQIVDIRVALGRVAPPAPLAWRAGLPILYESVLTPEGARYRALGGALNEQM
jgi:2'-5' RNA ligase